MTFQVAVRQDCCTTANSFHVCPYEVFYRILLLVLKWRKSPPKTLIGAIFMASMAPINFNPIGLTHTPNESMVLRIVILLGCQSYCLISSATGVIIGQRSTPLAGLMSMVRTWCTMISCATYATAQPAIICAHGWGHGSPHSVACKL